MKRIVEFGKFRNVPAVMIKDRKGEIERAFIVDENTAFAVEQFINYVSRLEYIGAEVEFRKMGDNNEF